LRRIIGAVFGLLAGVLGAALVLAASLDRPWVKRRVQALVLETGRVEIDYGAVRFDGLSGVQIDDVVVRSPPDLRAFAAELVRVGRLRVRGSPFAFFGKGPAIREVDVEHVKLMVVVDENGRTTFDAILPESEPTLPSRLPAKLLGVGSIVRHVRVDDIVIGLVRTERNKVVERDTVRGLALDVDAEPNAGVARLGVALGKPDAPLNLAFERHREGAGVGGATARASMVVEIRRSDARAALDIRVVRQDFVPDLTVDRLVHADVEAKFDPSADRTEIALAGIEVGDGVANAKASVTLPDRGQPVVHHASGDADLARLLRLLPPGLAPLRLKRGELHYRIDDLAFDRPNATPTVSLDGELTDADVALADGAIAIGSARLSLQASPKGADLDVRGTVSFDALRGNMGPTRLKGDGISLKLEGQRKDDGKITALAELGFAVLETTGRRTVTVDKGRLALKATDLVVDRAKPLASRGEISIEGDAASLKGDWAVSALASKPRFRARARFSEQGQIALDADLAAARLRVARPGNAVLADTPLRVTLGLTDISADLEHPAKSQGVAHVALEAGALRASVDATKRENAVEYGVAVDAPQLGVLAPFLPAKPGQKVAWDKMALVLKSKGRLERVTLREPKIRQHTELRVTGVDLGAIGAHQIAIDCESNGTAARHELHADVRVEGLTIGDAALGDDKLTLSASFDRSKPSLLVELGNEGVSKIGLTANVSFDRAKRAVSYDVAGQLSGLAPLAPLLAKDVRFAGLAVSESEIHVASRGNIVGVVSDVDENGTVQLAPDPSRTAGGKGDLEIGATHLRWSAGDRAFSSPAATLRTSFVGEGERRTIESDLVTDGFDLAFGRLWLKVSGFSDHTSATLTGSFGTGTVELSQKASIRTAKQNFARMYPVGDVTANIRASRTADGAIKISEMSIENRAGGTSLAVTGGIDLTGGQPRISMRTNLKQDLARASSRKETFVGRGRASLDLTVQSPDMRLFHTRALIHLDDAQIHVPASHIALDAVDGELPVTADVTFGRDGVEFVRSIQVNPYATLRFTDQHPLLSRQSFLSIGSLTTPFMSIAPFAANIAVEQNIVSLSQLEMGVRGGRITGNGLFEWKGAKSKLHADVRATGVQSSHGEPFDGNAALVLDFGDRSIEGRADIVRIGRRHLIDILDLQDPQRADASMNRIRTALALGYPKRVNIAFNHGFASAGVSFGGLAQLVSVGEVRGIPIGPLMERSLRAFTFEEQE
jgi:translocation and assembly module TamB